MYPFVGIFGDGLVVHVAPLGLVLGAGVPAEVAFGLLLSAAHQRVDEFHVFRPVVGVHVVAALLECHAILRQEVAV